jgi:D-alanyl-lipoteichoic acid acyltransferase DltB (MBOAT superfamily)
MLFDNPIFFALLAVVTLRYCCLHFRNQNNFLLGASYLFYRGWDWLFLGLRFASILIAYFIAIKFADTEDRRARGLLLTLPSVINFSIPGCLSISTSSPIPIAAALSTLGIHPSIPLLRILLPPRISFYTCQELACIGFLEQRL